MAAPQAGGARGGGAVYVFQRGQESYEQLCGLGSMDGAGDSDGTPGGTHLGGRGTRTVGGMGRGGGWGLTEILFDPARHSGGLFGFGLAVSDSDLSPNHVAASSSAHLEALTSTVENKTCSTLLVVGNSSSQCTCIFRHSPQFLECPSARRYELCARGLSVGRNCDVCMA